MGLCVTTLLYTTTEMEVSLRFNALLRVVVEPRVGPFSLELSESLESPSSPSSSLLALICAVTPREWLVALLKLSTDEQTLTKNWLDKPWLVVVEAVDNALGICTPVKVLKPTPMPVMRVVAVVIWGSHGKNPMNDLSV